MDWTIDGLPSGTIDERLDALAEKLHLGRISLSAAEIHHKALLIEADAETLRLRRASTDSRHSSRRSVTCCTDDLLVKYATILTLWPANTIDIGVRRLTGGMAQYMITARPSSSMAFYSELMKIHGQREESIYEIKFTDIDQKLRRGVGRITLPNTLPSASVAQ